MECDSYMERPFIIWTHRRCGGTNLSSALFKASKFKAVEHEPFNNDRLFGRLQKEIRDGSYKGNLKDDVRVILQKSILIKHCLEIINKDLNDAILEVATELGYRHLFLYRELPEDRLFSLNYAQLTGIWGSKQKKEVDESIFKQNINTDSLISHENNTRKETLRIYNSLVDLGATPLAVSFEMLYKSDFDYSSMLVKDIFTGLSVDNLIVTDDFLKTTLLKGNQGTNEQYRKFPNSDVLSKEAKKLGSFTLNSLASISLPEIEKLVPSSVSYFRLWDSLPSVYLSKFHYTGVIVGLRDYEFFINESTSELGILKGLPSAKISELFPSISTASNARFITQATECIKKLEIKGLEAIS